MERLRESTEFHKGAMDDLKTQLKRAYSNEEMYWSQKSRVTWLKEGDKNSQFFHASVKGRMKRNRMVNVQRDDGSWTSNEKEQGEEVVSYYQQLFDSQGTEGVEDILRGIPNTISDQMNANLTRTVTKTEIKLKHNLDCCISKNQAAFSPGRQILDNVIVSHEYLHYLKNKRQGSVRCMALKLDMAKAYDKVEWKFLGAIMQKMGFSERWINWIWKCLSTVSFSFKINGDQKGYVTPKRASPGQAEELMNILATYERGSGQMVNYDKSSVFFSKNTPKGEKVVVFRKLGNVQMVNQGKLCKDISAIMARYWWGEDKGKKKMQWCSWSKLTKDKGRGEMGFRDLQNFSKALLGKQL
ncbi:uncharacterized protein [Coffea arabica]|uniref:Reverse transcriptase domain-containing protein n=1 Tax=Coffea arabica TaxID=13443 RepID=A0ABM4X7Z8_COFAR